MMMVEVSLLVIHHTVLDFIERERVLTYSSLSTARPYTDLICCDSCPNAYHLSCLGLTTIADETEWFCPDCTEEKTRCLSPRKFAPSPSKETKPAAAGGVGEARSQQRHHL